MQIGAHWHRFGEVLLDACGLRGLALGAVPSLAARPAVLSGAPAIREGVCVCSLARLAVARGVKGALVVRPLAQVVTYALRARPTLICLLTWLVRALRVLVVAHQEGLSLGALAEELIPLLRLILVNLRRDGPTRGLFRDALQDAFVVQVAVPEFLVFLRGGC